MNFFYSCDDRMSRRETRVGFYANIEVWTLAVAACFSCHHVKLDCFMGLWQENGG